MTNFDTGRLSPVKVDSSTVRLALSISLQSALIKVLGLRRTISPGTNSSESTVIILPSLITSDLYSKILLSDFIKLSVLLSVL